MTSETPQNPKDRSRTPGKGRPTRSRREAQAARRRPLVVEDRKEARQRDREKRRAAAARENRAMMTGDEAHMPAQHRGRDRRLVRDIVDARHNVGEYFVPVAFAFMLIGMVAPLIDPSLYGVVSTGMLIVIWGGIALVVLDSIILRGRLRRSLTERFGSVGSGLVAYGVLRAVQLRPLRMPRPQVKHGGAPIERRQQGQPKK